MNTLIYNLFSLSSDAINGMKKKNLVNQIEDLKGKVLVGNDNQGLFYQISKLLENVYRLQGSSQKGGSGGGGGGGGPTPPLKN